MLRRELQRKLSGSISASQYGLAIENLENSGTISITRDGKKKVLTLMRDNAPGLKK